MKEATAILQGGAKKAFLQTSTRNSDLDAVDVRAKIAGLLQSAFCEWAEVVPDFGEHGAKARIGTRFAKCIHADERKIKDYEKENIPATLYIHSWELTPQYMPRISMSKMDYFITYHNLEKSMNKMDQILKEFKFTSFEKYLKNN